MGTIVSLGPIPTSNLPSIPVLPWLVSLYPWAPYPRNSTPVLGGISQDISYSTVCIVSMDVLWNIDVSSSGKVSLSH